MIANSRPTALVMGLGKSGISCVRHLLEQGYDVEVMDTRSAPPMLERLRSDFPAIPFASGSPDIEYLERFGLVVVSPGLSIRTGNIASYIDSGNTVVGDVELFARKVQAQAQAPIVAITGANGKSTVTDLVGHILQTSLNVLVGGNIGTPVLELLAQPVPDVYVLELSSFQLETTHSLNAKSSVVLNIAEDHMDRYRDLDDYADIKRKIFSGDGVMVLNREDERVMAMQQPGRVIRTFALNAPESVNDFGVNTHQGESYIFKGSQPLMPLSEIRITGHHNVCNVMAALALIEDFDLPPESVRTAIHSYTGLPHRCQIIADHNDVQWINDSKATNVGATVAALEGLARPVVLIAGGEGKDANFEPLAPAVRKACRMVILIGRDAGMIESALDKTTPIYRAIDLRDAINYAAKNVKPGEVVMLSPACASFDMFDNFEHRGKIFTELAQAAAASSGGSVS